MMNVKTGHRDYPKNELLEEVGEFPGNSVEAKQERRKRRGTQAAFTRDFTVNNKTVTLTAGGNNKKLPLLLIATYGTMLPGEEHVKTWSTVDASGTEVWHSLATKQTVIHALYRKWMNIVDLHNKLRQGVVSMADVWHTIAWHERHFAEGLGLWEVNVYKALVYFIGGFELLAHGDFRARLAWAFMTLGKEPYPGNGAYPADAPPQKDQHTSGDSATARDGGVPLAERACGDGAHLWSSTGRSNGHACAYCGRKAYAVCMTCEDAGRGSIYACGRKSKRDCIDKHGTGEPVLHGSWQFGAKVKEGRTFGGKRQREEDSSAADGSDEEGPVQPSPARPRAQPAAPPPAPQPAPAPEPEPAAQPTRTQQKAQAAARRKAEADKLRADIAAIRASQHAHTPFVGSGLRDSDETSDS